MWTLHGSILLTQVQLCILVRPYGVKVLLFINFRK